jgi:hypothetical protein
MTKELELVADRLDNLSGRLCTQVASSKVDLTWSIALNYANEIEQINHALGTALANLANARAGAVPDSRPIHSSKVMDDEPKFDLVNRMIPMEVYFFRVGWNACRAALTAQQKAPEGNGIVLCRECGKPTMHMGTLCFHCSKPDSAAHDGVDVEQMARELLGKHPLPDKVSSANGYDAAWAAGFNDAIDLCEEDAIRAIIAALRQPATR